MSYKALFNPYVKLAVLRIVFLVLTKKLKSKGEGINTEFWYALIHYLQLKESKKKVVLRLGILSSVTFNQREDGERALGLGVLLGAPRSDTKSGVPDL